MMDEAGGRLELLAERIREAHPQIRVEAHLLDEGRPVPALLKLAAELEVEMVATGTNGYGFLGRLLLGSVATQLVRRTRCVTLVAPPRGVDAAPEDRSRISRMWRRERETLPLDE